MHRIGAMASGVLGIVAIFQAPPLVAALLVAISVWCVFAMPERTRTIRKTKTIEVPAEVNTSELFLTTIRTVFAAQNQVSKQLRLVQMKGSRYSLGYGQGRGTVITHEVLPEEQAIILIGDEEIKEEGVA